MRQDREGLLKHFAELTLRISDLVSLGWGPRICSSGEFLGGAACLEATAAELSS